jgi:hypothetical protein
MSSPAWIKGLKELSKRTVAGTDFDKLWVELTTERNDRGAALIGATLVESVLRRTIRKQLVSLNETENDSLFGRDAPLSSFSDLIRIGYALGLFDQRIRRDLDRLREIRNAFAHALFPLDFNTPEISHACMGFETDTQVYNDLPESMNIARRKYLTIVGRSINALNRIPEWSHEPVTYED